MSIGIFDSGIGGLTVFRSVLLHFSNTSIYYLGDTARVPYGNKSKETILRYSFECASFLINKFNIECLIVACNTASALSIDYLKSKFSIPIIGVVTPGAKTAAAVTKNKKVGVIGTYATINSNAYVDSIKIFDKSIEVFQNPSPLLVPLVEEGRIDHKITHLALVEYIDPLIEKGVDTLILGCTHYPVLKDQIKKLYPFLNLVDSSDAIISEIKSKCCFTENGSERSIFITDESGAFNYLKEILVGDIKIEKISLSELT